VLGADAPSLGLALRAWGYASCTARGAHPLSEARVPRGRALAGPQEPRRTRLSPLPAIPGSACAFAWNSTGGRRGESTPIRRRWRHQPRFHGPGAGMLCCQRPLSRREARAGGHFCSPHPAIHTRLPACGHPRGRLGEASIPTRSARTPHVVRPRQRRSETPTLPGASVPWGTFSLPLGSFHSFAGAAPSTIPPREPHPREG